MPGVSESSRGWSPFKWIIGHNPTSLDSWVAPEFAFLDHPTLDPNLIEQGSQGTCQGPGE